LGISIIASLLEEIETGLRILEGRQPGGLMPTASWYGKETIPNEVLLRIISVDKNGNLPSPSFPVSEIRTHCKNYFMHICVQVNDAVAKRGETGPFAEFIVPTRKVVQMLNDARSLLEENSRRRFPK
jgi:hypothetical protein